MVIIDKLIEIEDKSMTEMGEREEEKWYPMDMLGMQQIV